MNVLLLQNNIFTKYLMKLKQFVILYDTLIVQCHQYNYIGFSRSVINIPESSHTIVSSVSG